MKLVEWAICSRCHKEVLEIDLFPRELCLDCHEVQFDIQQVTAQDVKQAFIAACKPNEK